MIATTPPVSSEVVEVSDGLVSRLVPARELEARQRGRLLGQERLLDAPRDVQVALDSLLDRNLFEEQLPLDRHARFGAEDANQLFVQRIERAAALVRDLQHA